MWSLKPKQQSIVGIDCSSTSVKILELSGSAEQRCVEAFASAPLPENCMEAGVFKDLDAVAAIIKQLILSGRFTSKQVAIAVPDSLAISKVIQINQGLSQTEIEDLLAIEAEKYIPFPIDEINIDFNVQGISSKNTAMQDVLLVGSRAGNVSNRVELIQSAGLEAVIVDVESYAVERAVQLLKPELPSGGENKVVAVFDIGSIYTHLYVFHNLKIIYSREEEFGGKQLVDAAAQQYGMSAHDVVLSIERGSFPQDFQERVLRPFIEMIFLQVKRSLQFFFSTSQYSFVDHIVLAGGVARQYGVAQLLESHIGVPTTVANPLASVQFSKNVNQDQLKQVSPALMVVCGLALRHME